MLINMGLKWRIYFIIWNNGGLVYWWKYTSLGIDELKNKNKKSVLMRNVYYVVYCYIIFSGLRKVSSLSLD